ncbi:hypothetical protein [Azospirillum sp.]|uniref:hypothetical protein n=1 Tax=Azospirillum sp. TaxID=34012 RepID=UPI002D6CDF9C|nr:hypothetical protein [Azospirillum sp.]HYF88986.1 hypothetical protein [Azospirillum sp.]
MARGGFRPGAGRKKTAGTEAPKSKEIREVSAVLERFDPASAEFQNAEEFLMAVVNSPDVEIKERLTAAVAVLPYQKPKMGEQGMGKKEQKAEAAKSRATGKFAPPPPPGGRPALN